MTDNSILIIEDDQEISCSLAAFLRSKGYAPAICESAEFARLWLKKNTPALILLDLMLPGESGLDFFQRLRATDNTPVIMVTALDDPIDNVVGLELGADDYVVKPFDLNVLLARIRAVMRRFDNAAPAVKKNPGEPVLEFSEFTFYPLRRYVRGPDNVRRTLTASETDLLLVLCQHAKKVISREDLIELTRGDITSTSMRSIDLLISRLRRKLVSNIPDEEFIQTLRSNGYMFRPNVRSL
ncbi:DNA-binding response regulator [Candidatus Pantoea deserta]|uniref:DNA-binding dual transcriptional regulator OmpR n=1 Tax=Candidatus Pantoea deserta TaxID=1869313 RepID=A0A3N4NQD9_9GAMM|nr:response regulator transcription factor [Pantoea deserta]RPD94330.1 DNA-binding response regulator [Pantoea deserta]